MVATFACVGALGLGATASGLAQREGWSWAALELGGGADPPGAISGARGFSGTQHSDDGGVDDAAIDEASSERRSRSLLVGMLLLCLYCAGILLGQLAMARGMATTRAGVGAILAVSEIAFAFLLDVALLREPTTPLAALGSLLVFASVGALACAKARAPKTTARPSATETRTSRGDEPLKRADAARDMHRTVWDMHREAWEAEPEDVRLELEELEAESRGANLRRGAEVDSRGEAVG